MRTSSWTPLLVVTFLLQPLVSRAAVFPDVPDDHMYREAIERLVGVQVINGNPDGTFHPEKQVNRAAMLKMLYKASGKTPNPSQKDCFPDVDPGSWYESFVCDASANRFVQGYSDGTFRPANYVNRAEAIKMITLILGIDVPELTVINREVLKYVDISTSAWYTKYLSVAFTKGILPITGQDGPRFYPDWPLLRGEAAAYIHRALNTKLTQERTEMQQKIEQSSASSVSSLSRREQAESSVAVSSAASSKEPLAVGATVTVVAPFSQVGTFVQKAPDAYLFVLGESKVLGLSAGLASGQAGKISCRLYSITAEGFSDEYYLGYQEGQNCYLLVALQAGQYQFQLEPTTPGTKYNVSAAVAAGDGNDGFSQARNLERGNLRTEVLSGNDYEDWFKFTVTRETELTLKIVSSVKLRCLVYPGKSVDLFGFSGPQCGETYLYPVGTYVVGVGHAPPRASRQTYSIQLK